MLTRKVGVIKCRNLRRESPQNELKYKIKCEISSDLGPVANILSFPAIRYVYK